MAESVMTCQPQGYGSWDYVTGTVVLEDDDHTFPVPDSIIIYSSLSRINSYGRLIAFPLRPEGHSDKVVTHRQEEKIYNRETGLNKYGLNRAIENVSRGSVMLFPVESKTPTPAIIIFPGGAFLRITIDKEGIDVAQRLNKYGITAIVVKYRTAPSRRWKNWNYRDSGPLYDAFYSDAKQAIHVIRSRAYEFGIDPDKIGVMGFSAGGRLAANLLADNGANKGKRKAEGSPSILPDFGCLVYPVITDSLIDQATSWTPPVFILNCRDDRAAPVKYAEKFYNALIKNRVESEAHFFKAGGHGFGLGVNGGDVARWPALFVNWMKELNMIDQR